MLNVTEVEHVGAAAERDKGCCPTCLEAMEMRILTIGFGEIGREVTEALSKARIHSPGLYLVSEVTDSIHLKQRLDDYLIHNIVTEYSAVLISGEWSSNSKMDLWISKLCIELHARNKFSIAFIADDYLVKSQKKARCSAAGVDTFIVSPGGATVGRTTILNTVRNTLDTYLTTTFCMEDNSFASTILTFGLSYRLQARHFVSKASITVRTEPERPPEMPSIECAKMEFP